MRQRPCRSCRGLQHLGSRQHLQKKERRSGTVRHSSAELVGLRRHLEQRDRHTKVEGSSSDCSERNNKRSCGELAAGIRRMRRCSAAATPQPRGGGVVSMPKV
jgi:hypothetical protein